MYDVPFSDWNFGDLSPASPGLPPPLRVELRNEGGKLRLCRFHRIEGGKDYERQ